MRIVLPLMFGLFAVIGGVGLVIFNAPKTPSAANSIAPSGLSLVLDLLAGETPGLSAPAAPEGALVAYLPLPPQGWTREAYRTEQGEALTGTTLQESAAAISDTNNLLAHFDDASRDANGAAVTYQRGEEIVVVSLTLRSASPSLEGTMLNIIAQNMSEIEMNLAMMGTDFNGRPSGFANVHGVNFEFGSSLSRVMASGTRIPINYRTLRAAMGGDLSIRVMTNASDAAIAEIIGGIDIPGLNETLKAPDLTVTPGTGLITGQPGALSTTPPEPTVAYKAFQKLRSDVSGLSQDEVRLLQQMANGDSDGWLAIYETFGLNHRVSPAMAEVLGEKPELAPVDQVRFEAQAMLGNPAVLANYEIELVKDLAKGRFQTREQAQSRLSQTRLYGPPVLRLISKLPAAQAQEVAGAQTGGDTAEPPREIVVRRGIAVQQGDAAGAECSIELGVRRCTVDGASE